MQSVALEVDSLCCKFGSRTILTELSFAVQRGETLGIVGPNGSGKTTLFNCISGFVQQAHGRIILDGVDISLEPPFSRARAGLGRVFQNPGIFRELTVRENLQLALERDTSLWRSVFRKPTSLNAEHISQLLDEIALTQSLDMSASQLSGGQMRLLEIARALLFGSQLLLLDEPTAGVAPILKKEVGKLIRRLQSENKTLIIIEHDMRFISEFCDRIIVLDSGAIALEGTPQELRESAKLKEIYLG
jgi:branched-chain amino acid transport system ATP-binding protein